MPPYTLKTGDSPPSNSLTNFFDLNFFEVEDNVAKQKYVAIGNLTMQKIAIMSGPNQPPRGSVFYSSLPALNENDNTRMRQGPIPPRRFRRRLIRRAGAR